MARNFDGTAGYLECTTAAPLTALPVTMACWFNSDSATTEQVLMCIGTNGSHARIHMAANGAQTGDPVRVASITAANGAVVADSGTGYTAGTWAHAVGVFANNSSRRAWCNGNAGSTGTATRDAGASGWDRTLIAARRNNVGVGAYADARIAEAGVWNAALEQADIDQLAAGYSPLMVRPESLVFYAPLHGRNGAAGNEEDWVGGLTLTQTSSPPLADHPRIIYPRRRTAIIVPAAAGGAPTITALSVRLITATSAQPRISYS